MKRLLVLMLLTLYASIFFAQDVTTFLGIPVDGTLRTFRRKLIDKGFMPQRQRDGTEVYLGEFNGRDVCLYVGTTKNKVSRVAVKDLGEIPASDIKARFNSLVSQFEKNNKYSSYYDVMDGQCLWPESAFDQFIPWDEDPCFEITNNNKKYEAVFYQKGKNNDPENILERVVWFTISWWNGKYNICMFYDNGYNREAAEDDI